MATHIIDAFLVKFGLDRADFMDGVEEVEDGSKRAKESSKKSFDEIERAGRKTGEAIKGVSREVIGLGLAFMGARSITGFLANMASGAASADRFGQTLGMSVKQVWAWRQAMKSVGGEYGDADAALQAVQNTRMGLQNGNPDREALKAYARLGINAGDLVKEDAGGILARLAGARDRMDPQRYASLLQQIGLPASTIYFLQQGKDSVDKLLKQYEVNSKDAEEAAKQAEKLQAEMAELNSQLQKALLPVLNQIVPLLTEIVKWMGGKVEQVRKNTDNIANPANIASMGIVGTVWSAFAGTGRTRADRNNNPGNIEDGPFARRQPGYAGSDGRFARFATSSDGFNAMQALLGGYLRQGKDTLSEIISKWAPSGENDTSAYIGHVSKLTGLKPNQSVGPQHLAMIAQAMAIHEGYSGARSARRRSIPNPHLAFARHSAPAPSVRIGAIHVNTRATDAKGIARDLHREMRHAVAQSDSGVRP